MDHNMNGNKWDNVNKGAMFKNDRKVTAQHPDRRGQAIVVCPHCKNRVEFWLAGWLMKGKASGKTFLSLAFTAKEEPRAQVSDEDDEDIPF
jgi:hypothetical protein